MCEFKIHWNTSTIISILLICIVVNKKIKQSGKCLKHIFNYTAKYTYTICYQAVYTGHEHIQVVANLHWEWHTFRRKVYLCWSASSSRRLWSSSFAVFSSAAWSHCSRWSLSICSLKHTNSINTSHVHTTNTLICSMLNAIRSNDITVKKWFCHIIHDWLRKPDEPVLMSFFSLV